MRVKQPTLAALVLVALHVFCFHAQAIGPSGVLVVYNSNVQESIDIANHYKSVYGLSDQQLLGLNLGTASTITANEYLSNIRIPVRSALTPSTDLIVTTKGMPLQIHVEAANPSSYTDAYGNSRIVWNWRTESSLESELAKIDYIASELMMGDQSFNQPAVFGNHFTKNLYYQSSSSFSASNFSGASAMRLTARLDGFTTSDVITAINKAQNAFVGPDNTPGGPFHFLVDADPANNANAPTMINLAESVLPARGLPLTYDNTAGFQGAAGGPVVGYSSFGANQAATPDYVPGVGSYIATSLNITLADGAVFNSWESFNAQSFNFGGNHGDQGLVAEWLAKGGTAAVGNVDEPEGSPNFVFNEDLLFARLLDGMTFAEAAWSSARQLSHVNTIVGDPLMTWKALLPGDANMDGVVDVGDLAAMGPNWGQDVEAGGFGWTQGDLNSDGFVDFGDLALVGLGWGQASEWSTVTADLRRPRSPLALALYSAMHPNPEPSSVALLAIGMTSLAAFGWCRRRTRRRPQ
ncbi:MAG: TIGR03790 family protein [Pirellulales bacterium]